MIADVYVNSMDSKCSKWVIGKKTSLGDRTAIRRHRNPVSWERLTYAVRPILTSDDIELQREEVWCKPCLKFNTERPSSF